MNKNLKKEVIIQFIEGDERAFNKVFNTLIPILYPRVFFLLKDSDLTDEVIQLTFIKIWAIRHEIDPDASLESFVSKIARNLAIDSLRKIASDRRKIESMWQSFQELGMTVEEQLILKENEQWVHHIISELPPQRQLIFKLCKIEGYTYQEVAEKLNLSKATVSNQMATALKQIREYILLNGNLIKIIIMIISVL